jgi:hypothetical protein
MPSNKIILSSKFVTALLVTEHTHIPKLRCRDETARAWMMAFFHQGYQESKGLGVRNIRCRCLCHSLLRIVRRICEYPRIKSPYNPVQTLDHNTVLICANEVVIQQECPLGMKCLSSAVRKEGVCRRSSDVDASEVLKRIGQLIQPRQLYKRVARQGSLIRSTLYGCRGLTKVCTAYT